MTPTQANHTRVITLELGGHFAILPAHVLPLLRSELTPSQHWWALGGPRGYVHGEVDVPSYDVVGDEVHVFAGLRDRITTVLAGAGYRVRLVDRTGWAAALRHTDQGRLAAPDLEPEEKAFVAALSRGPQGLWRYRGLRELARQTQLLCEFFPQARTFIVAKNKEAAGTLRARLREQPSLAGRLYGEVPDWSGGPGRIYVGPAACFPFANPDDWDVVVFADPEAALAKQSREQLFRLQNQVWYCALPATCPAKPRTMLILEAFFGPEWRLAEELRPADVFVVPVTYQQRARGGQLLSPLQGLRQHVWQDRERSRLIARIAAQLTAGRINELRRGGIIVPERVALGTRGLNVAVLVDAPEHARAVREFLPGWEVLDMIPPPADSEIVDYSVTAQGQVIVTSSYALAHGIGCDALVWAGGAAWPLTEDAFPRWARHPDDAVLMVDVLDRGEPVLRTVGVRRMAEHRAVGWYVAATPVA